MYVPPAFREDDPAVLLSIIRELPLGLLISQKEGAPSANLLPFETTVAEGKLETLTAHMARANDQWQKLHGQDVLVVFQGANAYVSPRWYESKREHGKVVPTWNYAVVQARGRVRVIEDRQWLLAQVSRLTAHHEAGVGTGPAWQVTDAPAGFIESQLKGIVGIEIAVSELSGKLKVSQNRPAADRAGVMVGLEELGGDQRNSVITYMRRAQR